MKILLAVLMLFSGVASAQPQYSYVAKRPSTVVPLGFRYKSTAKARSTSAVATLDFTVSIDTAGIYCLVGAVAHSNQYRTLTAFERTSEPTADGVKLSESGSGNTTVGAFSVWRLVDTLTVGNHTVRATNDASTAYMTGIIAIYRGPNATPTSGVDTTTASTTSVSFSPASTAGDSLLLALSSDIQSITLGTGTSRLDSCQWGDASTRWVYMFSESSTGTGTQIGVSFATQHFHSTVAVVKKQ